MNQKFNTIQAISYTRLDDVTSYEHHPTGTVKVSSLNWQPVTLSMSGQTLTVKSEQKEGGYTHTIGSNLRLKEAIRVEYPVLLKVEFCGGETRIIGTPYIPVLVEKDDTLTSRRLVFTHETGVFPLLLAL